jgi:hypothetical protein
MTVMVLWIIPVLNPFLQLAMVADLHRRKLLHRLTHLRNQFFVDIESGCSGACEDRTQLVIRIAS